MQICITLNKMTRNEIIELLKNGFKISEKESKGIYYQLRDTLKCLKRTFKSITKIDIEDDKIIDGNHYYWFTCNFDEKIGEWISHHQLHCEYML